MLYHVSCESNTTIILSFGTIVSSSVRQKSNLKNITSYSPSSMFNRVFKVSEAVGQSDGSLEVNLSSKAGLE